MSDEDVLALVPPAPRATTAEGVPVRPPDPTYPFRMWEVVELTDGMILMLDPQRGPVVRRIADDIYRYYGLGPRAVATSQRG